MDGYVFPGHPVFIAKAVALLGLSDSDPEGKPLPPIVALANLCAQAATAELGDVEAILRQAELFHRRLLIATEAAGLMLDEVRTKRLQTDPTSATTTGPLHRPKSSRPANRSNSSRS